MLTDVSRLLDINNVVGFNTYGEQFVRRMHQVYPIPQATIDRARLFAGAIELERALGGIQSQDMSLLLVHLGRARDSLPMLTPWV